MMNGLMAIWLGMRVVSYALLSFIMLYFVNDNSLSDTFQAMVFIKPALLTQSIIAFCIFAGLWVIWAIASWRFLFAK